MTWIMRREIAWKREIYLAAENATSDCRLRSLVSRARQDPRAGFQSAISSIPLGSAKPRLNEKTSIDSPEPTLIQSIKGYSHSFNNQFKRNSTALL